MYITRVYASISQQFLRRYYIIYIIYISIIYYIAVTAVIKLVPSKIYVIVNIVNIKSAVSIYYYRINTIDFNIKIVRLNFLKKITILKFIIILRNFEQNKRFNFYSQFIFIAFILSQLGFGIFYIHQTTVIKCHHPFSFKATT